MSVIVYIESHKGHIKKSGLEAATYASQVAKSLGTDCKAIVIGLCENAATLGQYGTNIIFHVNGNADQKFDAKGFSSVIAEIAKENNGDTVILAHTADGKSLAGRLAIKLEAGLVSGANALPTFNGSTCHITKSVYSGKALVEYAINTPVRVISVMGNTLQPQISGNDVQPSAITKSITSSVSVIERKTSEGIVPLPEAELVVSAGRGMKGPENWAIIEELAALLGATTACSRPVADTGWRPHHEHVGQTGVAIRPNLYIAAGISGAIQHLAGVNNSKVIVVINKDPEAPFFKAADYGVVGDLFDVVPRLTEAVKKYKLSL
jgi:electron transfer flavoprotein alpha subunit